MKKMLTSGGALQKKNCVFLKKLKKGWSVDNFPLFIQTNSSL